MIHVKAYDSRSCQCCDDNHQKVVEVEVGKPVCGRIRMCLICFSHLTRITDELIRDDLEGAEWKPDA